MDKMISIQTDELDIRSDNNRVYPFDIFSYNGYKLNKALYSYQMLSNQGLRYKELTGPMTYMKGFKRRNG